MDNMSVGADSPQEEWLEAKVTGIPFAAGDFIELVEPNAAGYGDPLERDPNMVREDILDDFTSIVLAREAYGVVFKDEVSLEIDEAATAAARAEIRAARDRGEGFSSLTDYYRAKPHARKPNPVSVAADKQFGR